MNIHALFYKAQGLVEQRPYATFSSYFYIAFSARLRTLYGIVICNSNYIYSILVIHNFITIMRFYYVRFQWEYLNGLILNIVSIKYNKKLKYQ